MDSLGFEPRASAYFTFGFKGTKPLGCKGSALPTELRAQHKTQLVTPNRAYAFQVKYKKLQGVPNESYRTIHLNSFSALIGCISLGGDPATDSPTATLLRLNPPCGT